MQVASRAVWVPVLGPGSQVLAARPVLLVDLPSCEAVLCTV